MPLQFGGLQSICLSMQQEIIKPDPGQPGAYSNHDLGTLGSFIAASGVTLLVLSQLGAAMVATVWAFSKLFGLPDIVMQAIMVPGALGVLWATIWTAGRAWHVEKRLTHHQDIDRPVFSLLHYFKRKA